MDLFNVRGRTALVTGASSGLGRHFAQVLADAGAYVVVAARRMDRLEEVAANIEKRGGKALPVEMDVTSEDSVTGAFAEIAEALGRPCDILVNNSGLSRDDWFNKMSEADWNAVIDTNLTGVWRVAKHATNAMIAGGKGGSIINIASITAFRPVHTLAAYASSKAAVDHLTRVMALEAARSGIRVNAIAPGFFASEMTDQYKPGYLESVIERSVLGRTGDPAELAATLVWLASPAGGYVTGQTIVVDGGVSIP